VGPFRRQLLSGCNTTNHASPCTIGTDPRVGSGFVLIVLVQHLCAIGHRGKWPDFLTPGAVSVVAELPPTGGGTDRSLAPRSQGVRRKGSRSDHVVSSRSEATGVTAQNLPAGRDPQSADPPFPPASRSTASRSQGRP